MSIRDRYSYLEAHSGHPHPIPIAIPEWPAVRYLERVLDEVTGLYFDVEWQAFCKGGGNAHVNTYVNAYVRVVLDLGDRPMYLFIHDEGLTLKLEIPVWHALPKHAYHFVLSTLSRQHAVFSFHLGAGPTDVLVANARFDLDTSLEDLPALLPYIAKQVAQAAQDLREHLAASSRIEKRAEHHRRT